MSDILHYQDLATNAALVKKIYNHLNPGGRLIIKDRFLDASGTSPAWTAAFAVHILVNTEQGACYRTAEAMQWMHDGDMSRLRKSSGRRWCKVFGQVSGKMYHV